MLYSNSISKTSLEQQSLAQAYLEKWRKVASSTQRIDNQSASLAVKAAYAAIDLEEPEIYFFSSPDAAQKSIQFKELILQPNPFQIWKRLKQKLITEPVIHLRHQLKSLSPIDDYKNFQENGEDELNLDTFVSTSQLIFQDSISIQFWSRYAWLFDFHYSTNRFEFEKRKWKALKLLVENCGRIYSFRKTCLICDRPAEISFDQEFRLHSETGPAIIFVDGYSIYALNGMKADGPNSLR